MLPLLLASRSLKDNEKLTSELKAASNQLQKSFTIVINKSKKMAITNPIIIINPKIHHPT